MRDGVASVLSVASFDFLFVPPRFSLAVGDAQYVVTLDVMLAVALITAQLGH
jgi:two-component system sensor histidine kinase KdpD